MASPLRLRVCVVDAFSEAPFGGNPAAVCLVPPQEDITTALMQQTAAEMNHSETAFVVPKDGGTFQEGSVFGLRWFTPTREVDLCGHATMATAAVLFFVERNTSPSLAFETLSGTLLVKRTEDGDMSMDLPMNSPDDAMKFTEYEKMIKLAAGDLPVRECAYSARTKKLLVLLNATRIQLEELDPDTAALQAAHTEDEVRGVILTIAAPEESPFDFFSRYFAPWNGIPEDPVTGSAHTVLAPYWGKRLGRTELVARQCSPRGGDLRITLGDDRVHIAGTACVVLEGHIRVR